MKISIDVDLTPEELRRFLGLPDVQPLQDELMGKLRERVQSGGEGLDPAALMMPLMSTNLAAYEAMQKAFWAALSGERKAEGEAKQESGDSVP